ncbi:MAG: FAD-dependent oxidoreductase [Actinobacteria bacterium]|nr:FAD-dependent oxidoreductase [Actinomycetota bacterium]
MKKNAREQRHPLGPKPRVIVVGGGVSGCACAATLARGGAQVTVISSALDVVGLPGYGSEVRADNGWSEIAETFAGLPLELRLAWLKSSVLLETGEPVLFVDRRAVSVESKRALERMPGLEFRQALVTEVRLRDLGTDSGASVPGPAIEVGSAFGEVFQGDALVLAPGLALGGEVVVGSEVLPGGRYGEVPANDLRAALEGLGVEFEPVTAFVGACCSYRGAGEQARTTVDSYAQSEADVGVAAYISDAACSSSVTLSPAAPPSVGANVSLDSRKRSAQGQGSPFLTRKLLCAHSFFEDGDVRLRHPSQPGADTPVFDPGAHEKVGGSAWEVGVGYPVVEQNGYKGRSPHEDFVSNSPRSESALEAIRALRMILVGGAERLEAPGGDVHSSLQVTGCESGADGEDKGVLSAAAGGILRRRVIWPEAFPPAPYWDEELHPGCAFLPDRVPETAEKREKTNPQCRLRGMLVPDGVATAEYYRDPGPATNAADMDAGFLSERRLDTDPEWVVTRLEYRVRGLIVRGMGKDGRSSALSDRIRIAGRAGGAKTYLRSLQSGTEVAESLLASLDLGEDR